MNKWVELLIGLLLISAGVYIWGTYTSFGESALMLLKGGIVWGVLGLGAIFLLLGISDLKG
jgi:hypothetical protein